MKQTPTVGRALHYYPAESDIEATRNYNVGPLHAVIVRVNAPGTENESVNLRVEPDWDGPSLWRTSRKITETPEPDCAVWPPRT